jgi:hypothetical protein
MFFVFWAEATPLEVREMVDVRQFCSERLEFCKWLFQNPSQMAEIMQTAVFLRML